MIEIKPINDEETYEIRKDRLRKNINLPIQFTGDKDKETVHLGLFSNGNLVTIVSLMKTNFDGFHGSQYQLRGMATKQDFQGKGFGKKLIEKSIELLKSKNADLIWCDVRVKAVDFYKKLGFKIIGLQFEIPQIGAHYVMFKKLN